MDRASRLWVTPPPAITIRASLRQVERFHQTLLGLTRASAGERPGDWMEMLPFMLFTYRATQSRVTRMSPAEILYRRVLRPPYPALKVGVRTRCGCLPYSLSPSPPSFPFLPSPHPRHVPHQISPSPCLLPLHYKRPSLGSEPFPRLLRSGNSARIRAFPKPRKIYEPHKLHFFFHHQRSTPPPNMVTVDGRPCWGVYSPDGGGL